MIVTFKNENMKLFTPEEIIKRYIECCIKMETATLDGDYKTNNYEGKKLNKIYNQLPSTTNVYWSKNWYEFGKTVIKIME